MGVRMFADKKGQAIFEFIVFLPIMVILYGVIVAISSAINGSINQQKATRGFTYGMIKGNPTIPLRILVERNANEGVERQGMFVHLFGDELTGGANPRPFAVCYKVRLFGQEDDEECKDPITDAGDNSSRWIRVKTAYGLCGASYVVDKNQNNQIRIDYSRSAHNDSCLARPGP